MCGIAGLFSQTPTPSSALQQSLAALANRGPDASGVTSWNNQWQATEEQGSNHLLHTRLSIMDTRSAANQPMQAPNRNIWICYNGEIYGWQKEAEQLKQQGVEFQTHSDTEFILQGYLAWGFDKLLEYMRGMFAVSILDLEKNKVFCARDRFGLKPLIYFHDDERFAFSSLVRGIAPLIGKRKVSPEAIDAYLAHRYIPAPATIFEGVQRLENGHKLEYDISTRQLTKSAYWSPEPDSSEFFSTLDEAIAIRTVADRPVGLFLSGGIDSSVIATQLAKQGYTNIETFTAAFPNSSMDESEQAEKIANKLGLPHTKVVIPESISADFDKIVADCDEPFADPSAFPLWYLAKEASGSVKVVLNGDGGDELFSGYKRYQKHLRSSFRRGFRIPFLPLRPTLNSKGNHKIISELKLSWQQAYGLRFSGFSINQRAALGIKQPKAVHWRNFPSQQKDPQKALLEIDRDNYLAEYILRKADLVSMAHGLEGRSPLLDHHLYNSTLALCDQQRFTKPAKAIFSSLLDALNELNPLKQKKRGFNPPLTHWLRHDLNHRFIGLGERLNQLSDGLLDSLAIDTLVERYSNGEESFAEQILQLLVLDSSLSQLKNG